MKKLLVFSIILLSFGVASAAITPDKIEFQYQMDYDDLRLALESKGMDYEKVDDAIVLDYGDFYVSVYEDRFEMNCKNVDSICMDGRTLQDVMEDLEKLDTFDLSKEDKETISNLYMANTVIRHIEKKNLYFVKLKAGFLKFLGKLFCTNYERIIECENNWCSLEMLKSKECAPDFEED